MNENSMAEFTEYINFIRLICGFFATNESSVIASLIPPMSASCIELSTLMHLDINDTS